MVSLSNHERGNAVNRALNLFVLRQAQDKRQFLKCSGIRNSYLTTKIMTLRKFENNTPRIGDDVYIDDTALIIGDVTIGRDSSIWPFTAIRGDVNRIEIGEGSNIQDHSVLHVTHIGGPYDPEGHALTVGSGITVGHRVTLHGCTIHDHCLIGMGSTIMDGAIVHSDTIIGAGSLVAPKKELEGGYLWLGSPARRARALTEEEKESIRYSARHYMHLKQRYLK